MVKKIRNSLSAKVFFWIAGLLVLCSLLIYGIVMIILPKSYSTVVSTQFVDEIMIEYKKDLNVSRAITEVNNRHAELEKVKQQKEEQIEQKLNDKEMLNRIDNLSAPKVEKPSEEVFEMTFKVRGTKEQLKAVKEFLVNGGYDYE